MNKPNKDFIEMPMPDKPIDVLKIALSSCFRAGLVDDFGTAQIFVQAVEDLEHQLDHYQKRVVELERMAKEWRMSYEQLKENKQ